MINIPNGWAIKSKKSVLKAHGNHGYKIDYSLCFSENMNFADEVPEDVKKSAKPGDIYSNKLTNNVLQQGNDSQWRPLSLSKDARANLSKQTKLKKLRMKLDKLVSEMIPYYASTLFDKYKKETLKDLGVDFNPSDPDYPDSGGIEKIAPLFKKAQDIANKMAQIDSSVDANSVISEIKSIVMGEKSNQLFEKQKQNITWGQYEKQVKQALKEKEQGGSDHILTLDKIGKESEKKDQELLDALENKNAIKGVISSFVSSIENKDARKDIEMSLLVILSNISSSIGSDELDDYTIESTLEEFDQIRNVAKELDFKDKNSTYALLDRVARIAKIKGLDQLVPEQYKPKSKEEREEEEDRGHKPIDLPKEKQNYGNILDSEYRYEPETTIDDLPDWLIDRFNNQTEHFSELIKGGFGKQYGQFEDISPDSLMAVYEYTSQDFFFRMNNLARGRATRDTLNKIRKGGGDYLDEQEDEMDYGADYLIPLLDKALDEMKIQKAETLYRGANSEKLKEAFLARNIGDIIYDHGYMSASPSEEIARKFGSEVVIIIEEAMGYKVSDASEFKHEGERLFPRGSAFEITDIKNKRGTLYVTLSHLPTDEEIDKYRE